MRPVESVEFFFLELRRSGKTGPITGRRGLSQGGRASHREAGLLTGRPGLLQGGRSSPREAGPLTGRLGPLQGGLACHTEAGPITGRLGLTTCQLTTSQLAKYTNKTYISISIKHWSRHFSFCNKTAESFTLLASQNPFGLGKLFPRSSAFWYHCDVDIFS